MDSIPFARDAKIREIFSLFLEKPGGQRGQCCTQNATMIVYVGDLIKLSVNSMYVFGTTNESRPHLRAGLAGLPRASLPS